jgi:hypothetical protein
MAQACTRAADMTVNRSTGVLGTHGGEAASRTLALTPGTWKLWSDIEGHQEQGMVACVTVTDV